ncbi:CLUMA_CG001584, isoform A [Clunio marinus]|uniref:CLUMA_CG001584, isoform A n=1 Tax=Clunio marinus TaxID=568069 RepID=A0A1J1HJN6_9DIPT|nr:CLUMA_CG001584, isoform A [Clunio marinus]
MKFPVCEKPINIFFFLPGDIFKRHESESRAILPQLNKEYDKQIKRVNKDIINVRVGVINPITYRALRPTNTSIAAFMLTMLLVSWLVLMSLSS